MPEIHPRPRLAPLSRPLVVLYLTEATSSVSGCLLTVGLPFFTQHRFGWGARENLLLGAGQGLAYVIGALSSRWLAQSFGRQRSLVGLFTVLPALGGAMALVSNGTSAALFAGLVLLETGLVALTWPLLESLVSTGADSRELSRRLGIYNVTWAVASALALAASGAFIEHTPPWAFFALVAAGHLLALGLMATLREPRAEAPGSELRGEVLTTTDDATFRQRRLALWLSRLSLPGTYVVVYALAPLFPSLPAVARLGPTTATLLASVWLVGRAAAFVVTGRSTTWHARPELLLWASVAMLAGFLGTVGPPLVDGLPLGSVIAAMVVAELVLGLALGVIYAGSLYFGMVSSEGSTEHGGYHEALIGLGQTLGPGVGVVALWVRPGDLGFGVGSVAAVIAATVALAGAAWVRSRPPARLAAGVAPPSTQSP